MTAGSPLTRSLAILFLIALMLPLTSLPCQALTFTPIVVEGNDDFSSAGFTGSGTLEDPYVLSGVHVDASFKSHGIFISNTTSHFRIVDCVVTDATTDERDALNITKSGSGIILSNVTNATLVDIVCEYNIRGITVAGGSDVIVTGCTLANNIVAGVLLKDCRAPGMTVLNSTFIDNGCGAMIEDCTGIDIRDNDIDGGSTGVSLATVSGLCTENTIEGNSIHDQADSGVLMGGQLMTSRNTVINNLIDGVTGGSGVRVSWGEEENVTGNTVSGCLYGVRLGEGVHGNIAQWNALEGNTYGVIMEDGADLNIVRWNDIEDGEVGVYVSPSHGNIVLGNDISRMDRGSASVGIYIGIGEVQGTTVADNDIGYCNVGLRAASMTGKAITGLNVLNNTITDSLKEGMYLIFVSGSQILGNEITGSGSTGVLLGSDCQGVTLQENTISWNGRYGLEIRNADLNNVTRNVFQGNQLEGVYLVSGTGNDIVSNALLFNKDSGRQYSSLRAQAYCGEEGNHWSLTSGNLWTDWLLPDEDQDGIVDLPYPIPEGCADQYPLTSIPGLTIPVDIEPPKVVEHSPEGAAVSVGSSINMTFSEDMNASSVTVTVNDAIANGSWNDRTLTLDTPLEFGSLYQVRVTGKDLSGNDMVPFSWSFETEGPEAEVSGRVVDENGNGLASVTVRTGNASVLTNSTGVFILTLDPGEHAMTASLDGYEDLAVNVTVQPGEDVDVGTITLVKEEGTGIWPVALVVLVIGAASFVLFWWLRKR